MATIVNTSDVALQAESPRTITTLTESLILSPSSPVFTVDSTGTATPTSLTVTANLSVIPGTVTWSSTGCTITSVGNIATLTYAGMSGTIATITATITDASGTVFTQSQTITKVQPVTSVVITVFQRAASAPTLFPGAATYTFASSRITSGALANGWTVAFPTGTNPVYSTSVTFSGPGATASVTNGQWSAITAFVNNGTNGTNGTNGSNGSNGSNGNSSVVAYCVSTTATTTTTPAATSANVPNPNDGGLGTVTWQTTTPTGLTSNQYIWMSIGVYNGSTYSWGIPFWASLKVGTLSAITANLGTVTAGTIQGTLIETAASGQRVTINDASNPNGIAVYNSAGTQTVEIGGTYGVIFCQGAALSPMMSSYSYNGVAAIYGSSNSTGPSIFAETGSGGSGPALSANSHSTTSAGSFTSSGSTSGISLTDTGANGANIALLGSGGTTPNKYIRSTAGVLQVVNSAYSVAILALTDAGALSCVAGFGCNGKGPQSSVSSSGATLSTVIAALVANGIMS